MPPVQVRVGNESFGGQVLQRANSYPKIYNSNVVDVGKPTNKSMVKNLKDIRPERPTLAQNLKHYFSEYCDASGIHGVRYLGERGRFVIEKVTWIIVITIVGYFCISLILKAYNKWVTSPVIVTFATKETGISKIPFPAVTICPEVKSDPAIFNYTDVFLRKLLKTNVTPEEDRYFESLLLVCDGLTKLDVLNELEMFQNLNLTVTERAMDDILEIYPSIDPNMSNIFWLGREYEVDSMLSGTFTSEGLCFSFNMLDFDDILVDPEEYVAKGSKKDTKTRKWSLEEGYPGGDKMDTYPMRTFISGIDGGLEIDMYTNQTHLDYLCRESLQGFKVTLHHPSELPNMDRHFRVPLDQAVLVAIKPRMITVSQEVKNYKPENRKCYFANERRLTFFKSYTQQNCLNECLSNYTLTECGCVAFYMPKYDASPICGPGSAECLQNSKVNYLLEQRDVEPNTSKSQHTSTCNCLPACTSLEYDVEISQTDWNWRKSYDVFARLTGDKTEIFDFDYEMAHLSKLAVYYREMQFLPSERHELYGYVDFFSNTGGLLGLFIGFSVTSAIEIVYFLTLRLACNIKKYGVVFWSGQ